MKAFRVSGGVGLLVRSTLFQEYKIEIIEKVDGIIGLSFQHKISGYCFVSFSCYLPSENSPCRRDASSFLDQLLNQIYPLSEVNVIYICRDLNARIGCMEDFFYFFFLSPLLILSSGKLQLMIS